MRNHICLITLYAFTYILYSCSIEQEYNSFNIIYCKEVSSELQYNNSCGTIEYRGEKYTIKKSVYYVKNKLQNVDVYRSDGIISYTKSEVESDKKLANYLGIPLVRIVVISKDKLLDNNTLFSYEAKGDSIVRNMRDFILQFGKNFIFMGNQYRVVLFILLYTAITVIQMLKSDRIGRKSK